MILKMSWLFYIQVEQLENQNVFVTELVEFFFSIRKNTNYIVI